jgi:hypothetical protein
MYLAFLSSSVVERSAVNRLVVGSNPTWGVFVEVKVLNLQGIYVVETIMVFGPGRSLTLRQRRQTPAKTGLWKG